MIRFHGTPLMNSARIMFSEILRPASHWTYFMQILSNYNTKSLYHFENLVIVALKSDIFTFYTCQINKGDI